MRHFYEGLAGWFDWQEIYSSMVQKFPSGSKFCEIGVYEGKSTSFLMVEMLNSGKQFDLTLIDKWDFNDNGFICTEENYNQFIDNTAEVCKKLTAKGCNIDIIYKDSNVCCDEFPRETFDFIFIDGDHNYEGIKLDLKNWRPKVKKGGIMGGHDYAHGWPGVIQAVSEEFPNHRHIFQSWLANV